MFITPTNINLLDRKSNTPMFMLLFGLVKFVLRVALEERFTKI